MASTQMPLLCFKVTLVRKSGPTLHRFRGAFTWDEFQSVLSHMWSCRRVRVEYTDEEGDPIAVGSALEWEECIRLHVEVQERNKTAEPLRLNVTKASGKESTESRLDGDGTIEETTALEPSADLPQGERRSVSRVRSSTQPPADSMPQESSLPAIARAAKSTASTSQREVPPLALPAISHTSPAHPKPRSAVCGVEKDVLDLLSALYECNAVDELCEVNSAVDMSGTVQRVVDPATLEVRIDIDVRTVRHAAVVQANRWMDQGRSAEALRVLKAATRVFAHDMTIEYNLACAAALQGEVDLSLEHLELAIQDGFRNEAKIRGDDDLRAIRADPRYDALMLVAFPQPIVAAPQRDAVSEVVPEHALLAPTPIVVDVAPPLTERTQTVMSIFPQLDAASAKLLLERHRNVVSAAVNAKLSE